MIELLMPMIALVVFLLIALGLLAICAAVRGED